MRAARATSLSSSGRSETKISASIKPFRYAPVSSSESASGCPASGAPSPVSASSEAASSEASAATSSPSSATSSPSSATASPSPATSSPSSATASPSSETSSPSSAPSSSRSTSTRDAASSPSSEASERSATSLSPSSASTASASTASASTASASTASTSPIEAASPSAADSASVSASSLDSDDTSSEVSVSEKGSGGADSTLDAWSSPFASGAARSDRLAERAGRNGVFGRARPLVRLVPFISALRVEVDRVVVLRVRFGQLRVEASLGSIERFFEGLPLGVGLRLVCPALIRVRRGLLVRSRKLRLVEGFRASLGIRDRELHVDGLVGPFLKEARQAEPRHLEQGQEGDDQLDTAAVPLEKILEDDLGADAQEL